MNLGERKKNRLYQIIGIVALLHIVFLLFPILYRSLSSKISPPKENVFRVKLGGRELSTGPNVGKPERLRPRNSNNNKKVETPTTKPIEPTLLPKEPKPPVKVPKKKVVKQPITPKKVVKVPAKVKPKAKPKSVKPKEIKKPTSTPKKIQSKVGKKQPQKNKIVKENKNQGYRPPSGKNRNIAVPIGNKDAGQTKGPVTSKLPGGGQQVAIERYARALGMYLKTRWNEPPKSLLQGTLPQTVVALTISADGRIVGYQITTPSGNESMDNSVLLMLKNLDRVPAPPGGNLSIEIVMQVEN